jgi:hypothetical protein
MPTRSNARASVAALVLVAGCAARKPAPAPPSPAATAASGTSSYAFVFDPANPALGLAADVKFDRPRPVDTKALPVYPERALAERFGSHHEIVRIVIDTHGNVTEVGDSPLGRSDDDAYAEDFRRAVDAAVRTWKFMPGVLRHVAPGHDLDGDGRPDYTITTSYELVPVYYDVKFTFEIAGGKALVRRNE